MASLNFASTPMQGEDTFLIHILNFVNGHHKKSKRFKHSKDPDDKVIVIVFAILL